MLVNLSRTSLQSFQIYQAPPFKVFKSINLCKVFTNMKDLPAMFLKI